MEIVNKIKKFSVAREIAKLIKGTVNIPYYYCNIICYQYERAYHDSNRQILGIYKYNIKRNIFNITLIFKQSLACQGAVKFKLPYQNKLIC